MTKSRIPACLESGCTMPVDGDSPWCSPHGEVRMIESQLRAAREKADRDIKARRESVKPEYQFTITPTDLRDDSFDRIFDDTCTMFTLTGKVTNKADIEAVGGSTGLMSEGSMRYLFNRTTGLLVCSVGGGTVWLSDREGMARLSEAIREHNGDGPLDVTSIVVEYRGRRY